MATMLDKLFYLFIGFLLVCIILSMCIILLSKILAKLLDLYNLRISRKLARLKCEYVKLAYNGLIVFRREHYKARISGDSAKQEYYEIKYNDCLRILSDPQLEEIIGYLDEENQKEIKRILSLPRYKLFK